NRQYYFASQVGHKKVDALKENLLLVNPALEIETVPEKIEKERLRRIFSDCHAVVEAMDKAENKKMLVERFMNSDKLLVAASGLAGWGRSDRIKIRRVRDNFYLVGDLETETGPHCPVLAPGVNVAAAKQADVVLSYFLKTFSEGGVDHS
ncbi:MAG: Thiamine biosynthesis protein ThiF, partial [Pelotomaculum thermopropionicum]